MNARVEISKRLLVINSASSLAARLVNASVLVWLQQYLLGRVTPEEYSLLPVLYGVMVFAPLLSTVLTAGLGRYTVEAYARNDCDRITQIVSSMFPILCGAGLLALLGGFAVAWQIGSVLNIPREHLFEGRVMMAMLFFAAAVRLPLAPFGIGLFIRQRFVLQNGIAVATELFRLTLLFVLLFGVSTRVMWVVLSSVSAELLNLSITQRVSVRLVPSLRFRFTSFRWAVAKEIVHFGGWNFVASLGDRIRSGADPIVLNCLATARDVTCFALGSMVQTQLWWMVGTVLSPINPVLTAVHATGDEAQFRRIYLRGGRLAMLLGLFLALPFVALSRPIIELYVGTQYAAASTVMALVLGQNLFVWGSILLPPMIYASGNLRWIRAIALAWFGAQLANLALTVYFVAWLRMGAVGSALATFLATNALHLFVVLPMSIVFLRIPTWECVKEVWLPGSLPAVLSFPLWFLLQMTVHPSSWFIVGVHWLVGAAVYVTAAVFFSLKQEDRRDLRRTLLWLRHELSAGRPQGALCQVTQAAERTD